jgi:hypothetical protein
MPLRRTTEFSVLQQLKNPLLPFRVNILCGFGTMRSANGALAKSARQEKAGKRREKAIGIGREKKITTSFTLS